MKFRKKEKEQYNFHFVPCKDSEGNVLGPEDILFVGKEERKKMQQVEIWGEDENEITGYNIFSEGVTWLPENTKKFPIGLITANGKVLHQKISAKTGEKLPTDAGSTQMIRMRMIGAPDSGKTVYRLQITDPAFHDMLAKGIENFSITDGLPSDEALRRKYEDARRQFKLKILPEVTKKNEYIVPYHLYVKYEKEGQKNSAIIRVEDTSGEVCIDNDYNTNIYDEEYLNVMVAADDILAGERGESVQYTKVLGQMLPKIRLFSGEKRSGIIVTITKCDLLDCHTPLLKNATKNSLRMMNGKLIQVIHEKGFNYEVFNRRSESVKAYIKETCPNFFSSLISVVPEQNITFCMIASVGEECHDNKYENYRPFCIDEPFLVVLAKSRLYPVAVEGYAEKKVKNDGIGENITESVKKGVQKLVMEARDWFSYEEDFDDEEGF